MVDAADDQAERHVGSLRPQMCLRNMAWRWSRTGRGRRAVPGRPLPADRLQRPPRQIVD
jgi:hypothetical protein